MHPGDAGIYLSHHKQIGVGKDGKQDCTGASQSEAKTDSADSDAAVNQIACVIRQDDLELTLYNDAEMGIVYNIP